MVGLDDWGLLSPTIAAGSSHNQTDRNQPPCRSRWIGCSRGLLTNAFLLERGIALVRAAIPFRLNIGLLQEWFDLAQVLAQAPVSQRRFQRTAGK